MGEAGMNKCPPAGTSYLRRKKCWETRGSFHQCDEAAADFAESANDYKSLARNLLRVQGLHKADTTLSFVPQKENDVMPTTTQKRDECFIRLPRDLYAQLAEIAEREDRSVAGTVRRFVREGIERRTIEYIGDRDPSGLNLGAVR
jgi:hypothetical protein